MKAQELSRSLTVWAQTAFLNSEKQTPSCCRVVVVSRHTHEAISLVLENHGEFMFQAIPYSTFSA